MKKNLLYAVITATLASNSALIARSTFPSSICCLVLTDSTGAHAGELCVNTDALIVVPHGTRALQTTASGNTRGHNAVDLQINNGDATTVASGNFSVITGGAGNTAQGDYDVINGGNNNTINLSLSGALTQNTVLPDPIAVGTAPIGIAVTPDGRFAYVANNTFAGTVSIIDLETNTLVTNLTAAEGPLAVAITPNGQFAYITNYNSGHSTVSILDIPTNTFLPTAITIGGNDPRGIAITPDGHYAYVTQENSGNVTVIDITTNTVVDTITVGTSPLGIALTPDGLYAYVANYSGGGTGSVSVIDITTNTVVDTITVGAGSLAVAITPDGKYVYVVNYSDNSVMVIDIATNTVIGSAIAVGTSPFSLTITPNGQYAYVANYNGNSVSVIDIASNTVVDTLLVGSGPQEIAITPDGQYAYVTNFRDNTVSVIFIGLPVQASNVIGGGQNNSITSGGILATIGGGHGNSASGKYAVVAGGNNNSASGIAASVLGGSSNQAQGNYSVALGQSANANNDNTFVYSDGSNPLFTSTGNNSFNVLATGGVQFATATNGLGGITSGVTLAAGGSGWNAVSDKNKKTHFKAVNTMDILHKVATLPLETWSYKTQDATIRHMGPYAQDFSTAFGLGEDSLSINSVDADGVALAAIQGLYTLCTDLQKQIAELQEKINLLS